MPSKTETISKTKARNAAIAQRTAALPKIPKEVVDQLVPGPMSPGEFNDLSMALQKALVASERLYTVLPLHAVWNEVADQRLQAARIVEPLPRPRARLLVAQAVELAQRANAEWSRNPLVIEYALIMTAVSSNGTLQALFRRAGKEAIGVRDILSIRRSPFDDSLFHQCYA